MEPTDSALKTTEAGAGARIAIFFGSAAAVASVVPLSAFPRYGLAQTAITAILLGLAALAIVPAVWKRGTSMTSNQRAIVASAGLVAMWTGGAALLARHWEAADEFAGFFILVSITAIATVVPGARSAAVKTLAAASVVLAAISVAQLFGAQVPEIIPYWLGAAPGRAVFDEVPLAAGFFALVGTLQARALHQNSKDRFAIFSVAACAVGLLLAHAPLAGFAVGGLGLIAALVEFPRSKSAGSALAALAIAGLAGASVDISSFGPATELSEPGSFPDMERGQNAPFYLPGAVDELNEASWRLAAAHLPLGGGAANHTLEISKHINHLTPFGLAQDRGYLTVSVLPSTVAIWVSNYGLILPLFFLMMLYVAAQHMPRSWWVVGAIVAVALTTHSLSSAAGLLCLGLLITESSATASPHQPQPTTNVRAPALVLALVGTAVIVTQTLTLGWGFHFGRSVNRLGHGFLVPGTESAAKAAGIQSRYESELNYANLLTYRHEGGDLDEALVRFANAASMRPNSGRAKYAYALQILRNKGADAPEQTRAEVGSLLRRANELEPNFAEAAFTRANLLASDLDLAGAENVLQQIINRHLSNDTEFRALMELAEIRSDFQNNLEAAEALYKQAQALAVTATQLKLVEDRLKMLEMKRRMPEGAGDGHDHGHEDEGGPANPYLPDSMQPQAPPFPPASGAAPAPDPHGH